MNFFEKLKYFWDTSKKEELQKIVDKLPSNEEICKEILEDMGNNHTKLKLDDEIKNSYYVYLNDTIYLCNKEKARTLYTRVVLISHECRHTLQSKVLQRLNFVFSNIELVLFVIALVLNFFKIFNIPMLIAYLAFVILSVIPRFILEFDAVKSSVKIAKKYMEKKLKKEDVEFAYNIFFFQINLLFPISIISLFFGKLFRALLVFLAYYFIVL